MPASIAASLIKGFAITPPTLGRITIGHLEDAGDGTQRPVRDDCFHLTSTARLGDGSWPPHPVQEKLLAERGIERKTDGQRILREIPIRIVYDRHDLNIQTRYTAFDPDTGRPLCSGDGETACRRTHPEEAAEAAALGPAALGPTAQVPCAGPENCPYGRDRGCKPYTRLHVRIEGQGDALGVFTLRTSGWNSARALHYKLATLSALASGEPAGIRMKLVIRARATHLSLWRNFYYVDLVADSQEEDEIAALEQAVAQRQRFQLQAALEDTASQLLANGAFETGAEDYAEFEELLPGNPKAANASQDKGSNMDQPSLTGKARPARRQQTKAASGIELIRQTIGQTVSPTEGAEKDEAEATANSSPTGLPIPVNAFPVCKALDFG